MTQPEPVDDNLLATLDGFEDLLVDLEASAPERGLEDLIDRLRLLLHELEDRLGLLVDRHDRDVFDPLTGVLAAAALPALLRRSPPGTGVMVFRVRNALSVIERSGRLALDQSLRSAVDVFGRSLRPADRLVRSGDEEFTVLADLGQSDPHRVVDRVLRAWEQVRPHEVDVVGAGAITPPGGRVTDTHAHVVAQVDALTRA